jgi:hypothetical protein
VRAQAGDGTPWPGAGREELLPAFDKLRERHMGMAPEDFNDDDTYKAGMNEVGGVGQGRPGWACGCIVASGSSSPKNHHLSHEHTRVANCALCVYMRLLCGDIHIYIYIYIYPRSRGAYIYIYSKLY